MYVAVDIGGTKTLLAVFDEQGKIIEQSKFLTPPTYTEFKQHLTEAVAKLSTKRFKAACLAGPGRIDRTTGTGVSFGNLGWKDVPLKALGKEIFKCPAFVENDAKLAGLSEAKLIMDEFRKVLYITISTGIGISLIVDGVINTEIGDRGGNAMILEHDGEMVAWESFASGKAIVNRYGMKAAEIEDPRIWYELAEDFATGIIDLVAITEPEVVVIGGGVGSHFSKFSKQLKDILRSYETHMLKIPPIRQARHAEEAVVYGCYEYIKDHYGKTAR